MSRRMLSRASRVGLAVSMAAALQVGVMVAQAPAAPAAAPKALILGDSVSAGTATDGSGRSLEEQQATADGFATTVVTGTTWDAMTAADFAGYQVLIIGDPNCEGDNGYAAAQTNATTWQPVVMASGGNKVLIGTDATLHNTGPSGTRRGDLLEAKGIAFAGAVTGATGAYVDTSCEFSDSDDEGVNVAPGTPVPIMDGLSTHGTQQFTAGGAPCAGAISIVASSGPTAGLHDADLSDWNCSVHAFFDHFPSDYTVLALATDASVPKVYAAKDVDTGADVSGAPYILVSGAGVTISSNIALTPATATNPVGGTHTVTATVTKNSSPVSGKTVTFNVDSGPNVGKTGTGVTNVNGQATFTYTDTGGAGTDNISATFVDDVGALEKATATKTWSGAGGTGDVPVTKTCTRTITSDVPGDVLVTAGTTCLVRATVHGSVVVKKGAAASVINSTVVGPLHASGATGLTVCNSHLRSSIDVSDSTGFVLIGDGGDGSAACAGNTIGTSVTLQRQHGGVELGGNTVGAQVVVLSNVAPGSPAGSPLEDAATEIEANHIGSSLTCVSNTPAPVNDGLANTVAGSRVGQCTGTF